MWYRYYTGRTQIINPYRTNTPIFSRLWRKNIDTWIIYVYNIMYDFIS